MAKFHVNGKGEPGVCSATKGQCPFGGEADHYTSKEAAQKAFEASQIPVAPLKKRSAIPATFLKAPQSEAEFEAAMALIPAIEDSKVVLPPAYADSNGYMGGSRYMGAKRAESDGYIGQTEAAKGLRALVRDAKAAGELPKWLDVSVRKNSGAWVTSIDVIIGYKPEGSSKAQEFPEGWVEKKDYSRGYADYKPTQAAKDLRAYMNVLARSYESSDSNPMVDYFNSSNAAHIRWRKKWD